MTPTPPESDASCAGVVGAPGSERQPAGPSESGKAPAAVLVPSKLGWIELALSALAMLVGVVALHALCLTLYPKAELDPWNESDFYPLSVFKLRFPRPYQLGLALLAWGGLYGLQARLLVPKVRLAYIFGVALLLVLSSNLLHGWRFGIDYPTATVGTGGIEYYDDAILIKGPLWFLRRFNVIQAVLLEHARTHPPGPVLLYHALHRALGDPGLISIAIGAASLALALPYLRRLLTLTLGEEPPGALLLYSILPAVLVYGIAVVDVVIAALFLATLVTFLDERRSRSFANSALWLGLSGFFTFAALFLLPVLVGFDLLRRRRLRRSVSVIAGAALGLALLAPLTGFDWWAAFRRASALENEGGFLLFANPRAYVWYRLGAVAEIMIFFTPFLCLLGWRGRASLRRDHLDAYTLAWLGPASLAAMLLAGALRSGEAARVCVFILPYLLLPVAAAFRALDRKSRHRSLHAVFAWGLLLELFGFYQW
jgi:hypothetical protein